MDSTMVAVTPEDRAAYCDYEDLDGKFRERAMSGEWDNCAGVIAFARHRIQSEGRTGEGEALLKAAIGLQKDLLDRAEWDDDCKVVCAGSGAWRRFCDAIDAAERADQ